MDEKIMRQRICKDLVHVYDACNGYDIENLDQFVLTATAAEIAALKDDPEVHVYEKMIPGPEGAPDIKLRIYEPAGRDKILPGMVFFHGGGFVFGSVYRQESLCQHYCKTVNAVIISVEYRLAPRWKAPAATEDGYAAFCWVVEHADEIGVDKDNVGIIGVSGGGNVCAGVSLMAKDKKGPMPVIQMPLYAELDHRFITKSSTNITSPKVWSYQYSKLSWKYNLDNEKEPDCYVNPLLCEDMSGLPPTFSYVGGLDPFRDENIEYWSRLVRDEVDVEFHVFPGCFHGFDLSCPDSIYGSAAVEATCRYMKNMLYKNGEDEETELDEKFAGAPA
ncbi:MAG: alpha/beta hydrolase fold domain-containing protein [Firmicutes bacterium]|nr:alpha/beta hydrolase fold domain-containing protein [Bacillota bacterium]